MTQDLRHSDPEPSYNGADSGPNVEQAGDIIVDEVNFTNLYRAITTCYDSVAWSRTLYRNLVNESTGPAYGGRKGQDTPVNLLAQYLDVYTMLVVPDNPQANVEPDLKALESFGGTFQRSTNRLGQEIKLRDTARQGIYDAFYLAGVVKIHRDNWRKTRLYDMDVDPGIPSATNVPPEDWAYDTGAKKWSQIKWCADKYRVPYSQLQQGVAEGLYDRAVVAQCSATSKKADDSERTDKLSSGPTTDDDELEPMIDLCDVWVQKTNKVYVCVIEDPHTFKLRQLKPLMSFEWRDPDNPPHHILGFRMVPHNIMPLSPASMLDPINRAVNANMNKEIVSVSNFKENLVYTPAGADTATKLQAVGHGVPVMGDPTQCQVFRTGGLDPNSHQALVAWMEIGDMVGGNMKMLAGLGASAPTLGQEQLLATAGSQKVNDLKNAIADWLTGIYRSLGFMLWEDSFHEFVNQIEVAGYKSDKDVWKPYEREGNFLDYNFKIQAIDLVENPPAVKGEMLISIVERVFAPMLQMIVMQGGQIDFATLSKSLAKKFNLPELEDVIKFVDAGLGGEEEDQTPAISVRSPSSSTRTQIRRSVRDPGTPQSRLQSTIQGMQPINSGVGAPAA